MIAIGLPQEQITLKRLNAEQAKLFDCPENYLTIGVFVRGRFLGIMSFGAIHGYLHIKYFASFVSELPYVARRMVKFAQRLWRATKKGKALIMLDKKYLDNPHRGHGLFYFKNYFKVMEYGDLPNDRQFLLE